MLLWDSRSHAPWREWLTYVLLALDVVYAYSCLVLMFGWGHCAAILCGEYVCCVDAAGNMVPANTKHMKPRA